MKLAGQVRGHVVQVGPELDVHGLQGMLPQSV